LLKALIHNCIHKKTIKWPLSVKEEQDQKMSFSVLWIVLSSIKCPWTIFFHLIKFKHFSSYFYLHLNLILLILLFQSAEFIQLFKINFFVPSFVKWEFHFLSLNNFFHFLNIFWTAYLLGYRSLLFQIENK